jgi:pSer/pThr/pTyr-binding forkhead associated (FHA) protein
MPVIKVNGEQFALQPGQNRIGGGATADVSLGSQSTGIAAVVELAADGRAVIRRAGSEAIRVNGMDLGQPTPLIHGDKVEIGGQEIFFADDAKGGSTQFVSASDVASIAAKRSGPARGTLATGGRLVSLVDGKEYPIPDGGVTIGRDASADIVVAQTAVSRRHAEVVASATGYVVNDLSTNGVFVNGEKVASGHALSRADVIRVGTEEFRFYADLAPMSKAPAPAAAAVSAAPVAAPPAAAPARPVTPPAPAGDATVRVQSLSPEVAAPPSSAAPTPVPPAKVSRSPTPPARPATPAPKRPLPPPQAPVTTKKAIPMWAGLLIVIAVAAVAAYFIYTQRP